MGGRAKNPVLAKAKAKAKRRTPRAPKKAPEMEAKTPPKRTAKASAARTGETLYSTLVDSVIRDLSWLGRTNEEMAKALGISETTFYRWLSEHPTMREASEEGREMSLIPVVRSMYQNAIGYAQPETVIKWNKETGFKTFDTVKRHPPNQAAAEFILMNRQGGRWKKKTDGTLDINLTLRRALLALADGDDA